MRVLLFSLLALGVQTVPSVAWKPQVRVEERAASLQPDEIRSSVSVLNGEVVYTLANREILRLPLARHPLYARNPLDEILVPRASENENHIYFALHTVESESSQWWNLYVDGVRGPDSLIRPVPLFSPDGARYVYSIESRQKPGEITFLVDGKPERSFSPCAPTARIRSVVHTFDGKYAATCQAGRFEYVTTDGMPGKEYESIRSVSLTADGRAVYVGENGGKFVVVTGQTESEPHAGLAQLPVTAGNSVGYIVSIAGTLNRIVVVNGSTLYRRSPSDLRFSPDGSRFAFLMDSRQLNVDGNDRQDMNVTSFLFSPDSRRLAVFGTPVTGGRPGVELDGTFIPAGFGFPRDVKFTADSRHVTWWEQKPDGRVHLFVDGIIVREVDSVVSSRMAPDGALIVVVRDGNTLKQLRITMPR